MSKCVCNPQQVHNGECSTLIKLKEAKIEAVVEAILKYQLDPSNIGKSLEEASCDMAKSAIKAYEEC